MKKLIILIFLFVGLVAYSQEFKETNLYNAQLDSFDFDTEGFAKTPDGETPYLRLFSTETGKEIFTIEVANPDLYDHHKVEIATGVFPSQIEYAIKIHVIYSVCCSHEMSYYLLLTKKGKVIELPVVDYVICDWPGYYQGYEFKAGDTKPRNIFLNEYYINGEGKVDSVKTLETYQLLNGKIKQ